MAEPVDAIPEAKPAAKPKPVSREAVRATVKQVIAHYPRVMA